MSRDLMAWEWLEGNQLSYDIWNKKYRYNNESLDEWFDRISDGDKELRQLIKDKKFLFGGRTLTNYNTNNGFSTSNCYSYGEILDDTQDILKAVPDIGMTYKSQGGQGLSLSKIRPKGSVTKGGYTTDGIIPFMELFDVATKSISQGGARKGALLMSLDAWHKEADNFIKIKSDNNAITKANLSLEIDDEFMLEVKQSLQTGSHNIINRKFKHDSGVCEYTVNPYNIFKILSENAHEHAEPGVIYTNRFRNYNLMELDEDYQIITANPCGQMLAAV